MVNEEKPEASIARLKARVEALERLLEDRSRLMRQVTRVVCEEDLMNLSRLASGLPPLPHAGFGLRGWRESTSPTMGDVDKTMEELWRSAAPPVLE